MVTTRTGATFLPRSLHPPLVHAPIGAVIIATACDLVSLSGGSAHAWAQAWFKAGTYALLVGTVVLVAAVATGLADRVRATASGSRQRARVDRHAIVMSVMGLVCVADTALRLNRYSAARFTPAGVLTLTLVALGLTVLGGMYGGRLVYRLGIGVATSNPPQESGHVPQATEGTR